MRRSSHWPVGARKRLDKELRARYLPHCQQEQLHGGTVRVDANLPGTFCAFFNADVEQVKV